MILKRRGGTVFGGIRRDDFISLHFWGILNRGLPLIGGLYFCIDREQTGGFTRGGGGFTFALEEEGKVEV